jgi:hypothetical protein
MKASSSSVLVEGNESFTGWEEMVTGKETRARAPTLAARSGQPSKILPKKNRMTPGANFPDTRKMDNKLPIAARLSILRKQGQKRFLMGGPEFPAGLYEFTKEKTERGQPKVSLLQKLEDPFNNSPEKFDWPEVALQQMDDSWTAEQYQKNLDYQIKKYLGG